MIFRSPTAPPPGVGVRRRGNRLRSTAAPQACAIALLASAALLGSSVSARAAWRFDCAARHNALVHEYTLPELRQALLTMPSQVQEYSNCFGLIQAQIATELSQLQHVHRARQQFRAGKARVAAAAHHAYTVSSGLIVLVAAVSVIAVGLALALIARRRSEDGSPPPSGV